MYQFKIDFECLDSSQDQRFQKMVFRTPGFLTNEQPLAGSKDISTNLVAIHQRSSQSEVALVGGTVVDHMIMYGGVTNPPFRPVVAGQL